jgi:DNA-binding MarR family transcriptional regulator
VRTHFDDRTINIGFSFLDSKYARGIKPLDLLVYIHLRRFVWRSKTKGNAYLREIAKDFLVAYIEQKNLAERLGISVDTLQRALDRLSKLKWVERHQPNPNEPLYYVMGDRKGNAESFYADDMVEKAVEAERASEAVRETDETEILGEVLSRLSHRTDAVGGTATVRQGVPHGRGFLKEDLKEKKTQVEEGAHSVRASEREGITSGELPQGETETKGQTPTAVLGIEQQDGFSPTLSPTDPGHAARLDNLRATGEDAIAKNRAANEAQLRKTAERKSTIVEVFGKSALNGRKPSPEVEELGICYAAEFKDLVGAAPPELSGKERGQLGNMAKRLGMDGACEVIKATFANWPKLSRQWRQAGVPKVGIILMHVDDVWAFVKSGGKTFGFTPTETRDEKERRLNETREEAYKTGPAVGWK